MTYLFFDIECANSFGGIGKICSFGYVLCTAKTDGSGFEIIETDDILTNPKAPFDWYLFKPGSKCTLSYSRDEYQKQPDFSQFYSTIASLLSAPDRLVVGFGCKNDISTIICECIRYRLPLPDFSCYDIHPLLEQHYQSQGGLSAFVQALGIDTEDMAFHDSRADAYFTMKVTEKLMQDASRPVHELVAGLAPLTSAQALKDLQKKLYKKWCENEEKRKAEKASREGETYKPRRISKRVTVPDWFDWQKAFDNQLKAH
ncbi:MAG: hypothetical protein K6G80_10920 [Treponema sp.]|nr:hypothetical protein [Treponema sp.]